MQKIKSFSLVEIIISLALFSFIITIVISISLSLAAAQKTVQKNIFLLQSAQTTLENISRNLRYGYSYSGSTEAEYLQNNEQIVLRQEVNIIPGSCPENLPVGVPCETYIATTTQLLTNAVSSPFVLFEHQYGDPTTFTDQHVYCISKNKLYKNTEFIASSNGNSFFMRCDDGEDMLPADIHIDYLYFDVLGQSSTNPINPTVRVRLKLYYYDDAGIKQSVELQTTVTQRLIQYL